jgi:hypothetical protein
MSTPCVSPLLARSLAARLRDAVAAGEQLSSFAFGEGTPAPGPELPDGEEPAVAHDFLLRVLHVASEPLNWRMLAAVLAAAPDPPDAPPSIGVDELAATLELPRIVVSERLGALIAVGLVARDLEHDRVLCSPAGEALFDLVCELEAEIARWLTRRQRR